MIALARSSTPIRRHPISDMKGLNASALERETALMRSAEVTMYTLPVRTGRVKIGSLTRSLELLAMSHFL